MADRGGDGWGIRSRARRRLRLLLFTGTALVLTGFVLAAYGTDVVHDSELDTVDARFTVRGDRPTPKDVVVVQIDDVTFNDLSERWPFRRSTHAKAVEQLTRAGAKAIAYDVQFTEPTTPREDNALIDAVDRARNVVLATTEVDDRGRSRVFGGGGILKEIGARDANAGYVTDSGGVIRRMPYELDKLKGFGVTVAEVVTGKQLTRDDAGGDIAWIDWSGPPGTLKTISFSKVVRGKFAPGTFRNKIAVIGASAPSLQDVHATAVTGNDLMAGPEVQAESVLTALRGFPIDDVPGAVNVILIVLLGLLAPLMALRWGARRALISGALTLAAYLLAVQLAFNSGWIVSLLYPGASLTLGIVGAIGVSATINAFERERVREIFSRFVPPEVVDKVIKDTRGLRLGGERRVVTVLFSDIRGFTTFSEERPPEVVIEVLNRYLSAMTDVIHRHGGTLIAFMGDGIMAVFGAPQELPDHADRALAAAREMTGRALDAFNAWMRDQGHGDGFRIGVGLNSGAVMAGNVGSDRRMEYTAIGDTTNTASRLEGLTKGTPHMIFLADSTREMLTGDPGDVINVDEMEVRGREAKVVIWSVE
jgi:adenylate cyclase